MTSAATERPGKDRGTRRSTTALVLMAAAGSLVFTALVALGIWQIQRRAWKHDLIAAVNSRVDAPPVAPPGPGEWPAVSAQRDAYRHVRVTGRFDHRRETLVQAVTEKGPGSWVLTPLRASTFTVLINRGFVPPERRQRSTRANGLPDGVVTVTGLLRVTEPGGAFLRSNDPAASKWYSRDIAAIAQAKGLGRVAPYFIDADATPNAGGYPIGGLTVIRFPDSHMAYALTWFGLALMVAGAMVLVGRHEWRLRREQ